jgi:acyl-homoserine lactone acylase PvdQ
VWRTFALNGKRALVLEALADAVDFVQRRFRTTDIDALRWSDFHGADFMGMWREGLETVRTAVDGGPGSIDISPAPFFANDTVTTLNYARGSRGDLDDPFARNLHTDWAAGRYEPWRFRPADVAAHTTDTTRLPRAR